MPPPETATLEASPEAPPEVSGATTSHQSTTVAQIELKSIDRTRNHRIDQPGDEAKIRSLMESIESAGQLQPVRVYVTGPDQKGASKKPFLLGFGARRCIALERLGEETVTAMVFESTTDAQIETARAIENLHRQDISPMEEVLAVANMLAAMDQRTLSDPEDIHAAVAARLGRSTRWVKDRDYLHRLSPKCQAFALKAQLPAGHLREIAKLGDPELQFNLVCEAAGTSVHLFKITGDTLEPRGKAYKKHVDEFWGEVDEGSVNRATLREMEKRVAEAQRSLRMAPWVFELPVVFGKVELPPCSGCEHNSETDRTLFGVAEDPGNPRGVCLNPSCYKQKQHAVDQAKSKLIKAFSKAKQTPAADAIDAKTPDWLKQTTARSYIHREYKKRTAGNKTGDANPKTSGGGASGGGVSGGRKLTVHEVSLGKFDRANDQWQEGADKLITKALDKQPLRRAATVALLASDFWSNSETWDIPTGNGWNEPTKAQPNPPKDVDPALMDLVTMIKSPTLIVFEKLGRRVTLENIGEWNTGILSGHPAVIDALARAVGVQLKPAPTWDDFKPSPPPPPVVKKKSQTTRKKVMEKKPAIKRAKKKITRKKGR